MSIDYSMFPVLGFRITEVGVRSLARSSPEKFHMEDRYDRNTGAKQEQEKVVDIEESRWYEFRGERYDSLLSLCAALAIETGCSFASTDHFLVEESGYFIINEIGNEVRVGPRISVWSRGPVPKDIYARLSSVKDSLQKLGAVVGDAEISIGVQTS